jgi:hypothetical protein
MGWMRNAYVILVGKTEEKRQLRKSRYRWEDSITRDLEAVGWEGVDWINLAKFQWRALVNTVMNLRFP